MAPEQVKTKVPPGRFAVGLEACHIPSNEEDSIRNLASKKSNKVQFAPLGDEFPSYRVGDDGSVWSRHSGRWQQLKPDTLSNGRLEVHLIDRHGDRRHVLVQRAVLTAFVGECPPGCEACHGADRDPRNCRLENLRWDTHKANTQDSIRDGTFHAWGRPCTIWKSRAA